MSYRNKVYVCLDYDEDKNYYNIFKAWNENQNFEFQFNNAHEMTIIDENDTDEEIKRKLLTRLENSKLMIVLVGEHTKNLYKFVRWELEYALENDLPIIVVNLNKKRTQDNELVPPLIKDKLSLHIAYEADVIVKAMKSWPDRHKFYRKEKYSGAIYYKDSVYKD